MRTLQRPRTMDTAHPLPSRALLAACLCLFVCPAAVSRDTSLFINSSPMDARVLVDGNVLPDRTPVLLRGISPGEHTVTCFKDGYDDRSRSIVVRAEEVAVAELDLYRQTFGLSLPDEPRLTVGGTRAPGTGSALYRLPEGQYELSGGAPSGLLRIERVYPRQGLIDGLNVAIPIFLAFSGVLTAGEILFPPEQARVISPALVTSHILTLGLIGLDVALHEQKRRFFESLPPVGPPDRHVSAAELYGKAEAELAGGRTGAALAAYSRIVTERPDSPYTPHALYRIARVHQIRGNRRLAEAELEILIREYPVADLYDRALKNLSDLYLEQGRYRDSLERLDDMLLHDPLYSEEEIELRRGRILERWSIEDADGDSDRAERIRALEEELRAGAGQRPAQPSP